MSLSKQFGLTPHDEYDLFKNQAGAAATNPGLFGGALAVPAQRKGEPEEEAGEPAADVGPRVGMLGSMDTPPPGQRPN